MNNRLKRIIWMLGIPVITLTGIRAQKLSDVQPEDESGKPLWISLMQNPNANFFEVQRAFNAYWQGRTFHRGDGYKPFKRWEYYWQTRVNPDGSFPKTGRIRNEVERFAASQPAESRFKSANSAWLELGPKTRVDFGGYVGVGRLNAVACHPTDTATVYVGSPSGGLWKSTDSGKSWNVLTDGMPSLGVSTILIHPDRPDEILVGTGDRDHNDARGIGVIRSTDGGKTWSSSGEGMGEVTVGMLDRCSTDPNLILAATAWGIFRSNDGGLSWSLRHSVPDSPFKDIKFKPGSADVAYATCVNQTGFFRSADSGLSWERIPPEAGIPSVGRFVIGVSPGAPNLVYLVCGNVGYVGCYASQDEGKTFITQSTAPNILGWAPDGSDEKSQAWYDLCIHVDPFNANIVHVGGINLWRSDNAGKDWKLTGEWQGRNAQEVHADHHGFFYNKLNRRLYVGNDGGVYYTGNQGLNWTEISEGLGIGQIYRLGVSATNPYKVITGFQDNGSATWTGKEWLTSGGGDGMESAIDPLDYQYSYATIYFGTITQLAMNDTWRQVGGKGFGGIDEEGAWVTPFLISETDGNTMVAGYNNVWITHDLKNPDAVRWTRISDNLAGVNYALILCLEQSPAQPAMLYFSRSDSRFFRTGDFITENPVWTDLTGFLPSQGIVVDIESHPYDPETVYISLNYRIYKSSDRGETWTDISGSLPEIQINSICFDKTSEEGLYIGTEAGAYYRDAGMTDWVFYNTNLPLSVEVSELETYLDHLDRSKSRLKASTFGRGLWETPLAEAGPVLPATRLVAEQGKDRVGLSWNVPFYPQHVTGYRIFRNGAQAGWSDVPYWNDGPLLRNTDFTYQVVAEYGNSTLSPPSNRVTVSFDDPVAVPYQIDFEPGSGGWKSGKTSNGWVRASADELGITGNTGSFWGIRGSETTVNNQVLDCLASPPANLSPFAAGGLVLSFRVAYLRSPEYGKFNLVYRTAPDAAWTSFLSLDPTDGETWIWKTVEVALPVDALTAFTQIGFLYENHGTAFGGAGIDDIRLDTRASGIRSDNLTEALQVYPNPGDGLFQVEFTSPETGETRIEILDLSGRMVREFRHPASGQPFRGTVDLRDQPKGVYQVRVKCGNQTISRTVAIQ